MIPTLLTSSVLYCLRDPEWQKLHAVLLSKLKQQFNISTLTLIQFVAWH